MTYLSLEGVIGDVGREVPLKKKTISLCFFCFTLRLKESTELRQQLGLEIYIYQRSAVTSAAAVVAVLDAGVVLNGAAVLNVVLEDAAVGLDGAAIIPNDAAILDTVLAAAAAAS